MIQDYEDGTNKDISCSKRLFEDDVPPAVLTGPLKLPTFTRTHSASKRSRKTLQGQFMVAASSIRTPTTNPQASLCAKISVDKVRASRASLKNHVVPPLQNSAIPGLHITTATVGLLPKNNTADHVRKYFPPHILQKPPTATFYGQKTPPAHRSYPNIGTTIVTAIDLGLAPTKDTPVALTKNSHPMQQSNHSSSIDRYLLKLEKSPLECSQNISASVSVKSRDVTSVHSYSLTSASSVHSSCGTAQSLDNKSAHIAVASIASAFSNTAAKTTNKRPSSVLLSEIPKEQQLRDIWQLTTVCNRILYCTVKSNMLMIGSDVSNCLPNDNLSSKPKKIRTDTTESGKGGNLSARCALSECLKRKIRILRTKYYADLIEAYFLQNGGHYADFTTWRGKNLPRAIIEYIKCNLLPGKSDEELKFAFEIVSVGPSIFSPSMLKVSQTSLDMESNESSDNSSDKLVSSPSTVSMPLIHSAPSPVSTCSQSPDPEARNKTSVSHAKLSSLTTKALSKHNLLSAVYDSSIGSQQEIVERAKQEASVIQKIGDLRKEGLWSLKKLPKVQESGRSKAHWDYLLEEMTWLSADFAQERKWKKAAAKKCSRMIIKYFQEKEMKAEKAEKEELIRLKRLAATVSKEVKVFWANIEKLVEYKQQTWIDARKKKVLDSHLNFIVDQTEKYSSWLTEGLNQNLIGSVGTSRVSSPMTASKKSVDVNADDDYVPSMSESDNEDTIAKEEEEDMDCDVNTEIELLKTESELPIEDIIEQLPKEILQKPATLFKMESTSGCKNERINMLSLKNDSQLSDFKSVEKDDADDNEYQLSSSEDEDDEETLKEQEEKEQNTDYLLELNDLKNESELPIEKLLEKYQAVYDTYDMNEGEESSSEDTASLKDLSLMDSEIELKESRTSALCTNETNPSQEITDIAATAESFQPKGNTLSTTQVCTKIPFLLKHQLREYQHIGLDWLNAMYEKKLNGILADEMGLGKTIQTISLLAHLACEKGVWGPHLIVVPTSVMLNWEMELKKWCPAFKILTYYGTPKERKQKRTGWTKQNAFHVCITSYKLVVQDHHSFRRKRWIYLILDEAQHIKNFKSQRWQMLLNFQSTHRLLLTGTPLQNNLMELWSLMHFLMPNVFQSHRDFREWFVNPVTGMIEGNHEYNESLIKRLHKVLRPFLLRRLKCEVEKQLPKKYEHIVMCRLSKRQRYLYDDFMSQAKTKETLASGNFMSVINILMQLRKVCNHPNMFEPRPILSPFMMTGLTYNTSSIVCGILDYDPTEHICLWALNLLLADIELCISAFAAHRIKKFQTPPCIIEMADRLPETDPPTPCGKIKLTITSSRGNPPSRHNSPQPRATVLPQARVNSIPNKAISPFNTSVTSSQRYMMSGQHQSLLPARPIMNYTSVSGSPQVTQHSEYNLQLLQQSSGVLPQVQKVLPSSVIPPIIASFNRAPNINSINSGLTTHMNYNKPIGRVAPLNIYPPLSSSGTSQNSSALRSSSMHSIARPQKRARLEVPVANSMKEKKNSELYMDSLVLRQAESRLRKLHSLGKANILRCAACPMYGPDLMEAVSFCKNPGYCRKNNVQFGHGYVNCLNAPFMEMRPRLYWRYTKHLCDIVTTPEKCIKDLTAIIQRFAFIVPSVTAPPIQLHVSHPRPSKLNAMKRNIEEFDSKVSPSCALLHPIISNTTTYFPDPRLIEYDCGKLQRLAHLLRELKSGQHRALVFTQMTRMLDILEQFLSYHGHTYLRLDGSTKIEKRQALMEQFNADKKIFCFILSTRSGGIGVNLTGADTVIFYDSDWNPTMDAQAQDRCHRIGQTRDVHIYRLISEKTIEENILKKANQKRLLGDLAIEGGNFTTAFFKKRTLHELFGLDDINNTESKTFKVNSHLGDTSEIHPELAKTYSEVQLEQALGMAEEELDLKAAAIARDEAAAEFAEFDESIPFDNDSRDVEEKSPAEEELDRLMEQLTPVEKYAMRFFESLQEPVSLEKLRQEEEEIEAQKREWELDRLKALKEEEERKFQKQRLLNKEDPLLSYSRETISTQVFITIGGQEEMPIWSPPTPPSEDDMYFDYDVCFSYNQTTMAESILPTVFMKKENKQIKMDPIISGSSVVTVARKQKVRKDDITIPRSLFDRPTAAILKMRREAKLQKFKGIMGGSSFTKTLPAFASLKPTGVIVGKPSQDCPQDSPEWLVYEDWSILQIIQSLQGLTLTLMIVQPAHIPNWDLCGESVNALKSRLYRSPKQCKNRYESIIVPREEGKILYDANPKKPKKTKGIYKTKNNRPMRTSQLYLQDNNNSFSSLTHVRFGTLKSFCNRKNRRSKPWISHSAKSNRLPGTHADSTVNFDQPLLPTQIALIRAERIAREKKNQTALVAQVAEQQLAVQRQGQQTTTVAVASANLMQHQAQAVIASLSHPHQLQNATIAALASSNLRASQRAAVTAVGTTTTMTVQEMVAAVGQVRALTTCSASNNSPTSSAVVSVAGLTAVQLQAASQRLASALPTTTTGSTLGLTPAQRSLQLAQYQTLRQNAILRQQREQTLKHQQLKRLQATQQHGLTQGVTNKVSVNSATNNFSVTSAQQRLAQQATIKQTQGRTMTDVEVAQLVKRQHQLQQQKQAQLTTAQILAQAQLQQVQQAQLQQAQQQQTSITAALQTSVATLVKTVSAPSISGAQSVTIPVSAAGVNINVSLPQGKAINSQAKATTTITNQQLRQLQLQQQLILQARKGQKVTNLSQLTKIQGKGPNLAASALTNQLNTVQIIQQSGQGTNTSQAKNLQTTMTMQQIQQAMKQVIPQTIPLVSATQGNGCGNGTSITHSQILSHHAVLPTTSPNAIKSGVPVSSHSSNVTTACTSSSQTLTTSSSQSSRILPVTQSTSVTTTSIPSQTVKQTIQVQLSVKIR